MDKEKLMPVAFCGGCCERMELVDNSVLVNYQVIIDGGEVYTPGFTSVLEGEKYKCPKCGNVVIINLEHLFHTRYSTCLPATAFGVQKKVKVKNG